MGRPYAPLANDTPLERCLKRVEKTDSCWLWKPKTGDRYGLFWIRELQKQVVVHRWLYQQLVGPIPPHLELDHLCRNRRCCSPAHLEPVTHRVNSLRGNGACAKHARQSHCKHGHELTNDNVYVFTRTYRQCKTCKCEYEKGIRRQVKQGKRVAWQIT